MFALIITSVVCVVILFVISCIFYPLLPTSIRILQKTVNIVLQVSENQDEITCTQSLHCLVLKTSCIIRVSLGCFILLYCESNVVVLQSFLETVVQSKTERFKIQCKKAKYEGLTEMLAPSKSPENFGNIFCFHCCCFSCRIQEGMLHEKKGKI